MDNVTKCLNFGYIGHLILALCIGALFSYLVLGTKDTNVEGWQCKQIPLIGLARCVTPNKFNHLSTEQQAHMYNDMASRNGFF